MHYYPHVLDGPKFVAWLDSLGVGTEEYPENNMHGKLLRGENLTEYRADKLLTHLGMHINQIPIDIWIPHYKVSPKDFIFQLERQRECLSV